MDKCEQMGAFNDTMESGYVIACTNCSQMGYVYLTLQPKEDFYKEGWRATKDHVLCPECATEKSLYLNP